MIIWFTGISGVGKTTLGFHVFKKIKKKFLNTVFIDGDKFRKLFRNDLGFSLKDRNKNAERLISFTEHLYSQKIIVIISANITSPKYLRICRKKFKKFLHIHIESPLEFLKKRDPKKIYKKNKNIVGIQIKSKSYKNADILIRNDKSKKYLMDFVKKILNKFYRNN